MATSIATTSIKLVDGQYYKVTMAGGDEGYGDAARVRAFDKNGKSVEIEAGYERIIGKGGVEEWVAKVPVEKLRQAGLDLNSLGITGCLKRPSGEDVWELINHQAKNGPADHTAEIFRPLTPSEKHQRGVDLFCGRLEIGMGHAESGGHYTTDERTYLLTASLRDEKAFFAGAAEIKVAFVPKLVTRKGGGEVVNSWLDTRNIAIVTLKRQADGTYASDSLGSDRALLLSGTYYNAYDPSRTTTDSFMVAAYIPGEDRIDSRYETMYEISVR